MSTPAPPPAPLESSDPQRARIVKTKALERISDIGRHLTALRVAMGEFGENFDLEPFRQSYNSQDPVELNRVKAVERGVDLLYNYIADLAAFGLELAGLRGRRDETNARRDLDALRDAGVLTREQTRRLQQLRELRRLLVHEYATATAEQVHESAQILIAELSSFSNAYRDWIRRGFRPTR